jgi:nucleoside-diphosphate-sugar epimerase
VFSANIDGTRCLLDSLPNVPEKIIYSSTLDVYSVDSSIISESSSLASNNFYSSSKLFSEYLIKDYCIRNKTNFFILRFGHIYGPGEFEYKKFIPTVIKSILKDEEVIIYGDGENKRDFLYIDDAVESIIRSILLKDNKSYLINIVSGKSKSLNEYLSIIFTLLKYNKTPIYKKNDLNQLSYFFDNKKMIETFGNFNFYNIDDGILNEINYIKRKLDE